MMGLVLEIEIDILIKKLFDFLFGAFPKENYFSEMSFSVVNIRFHPGGSLINSDFFLFVKNLNVGMRICVNILDCLNLVHK